MAWISVKPAINAGTLTGGTYDIYHGYGWFIPDGGALSWGAYVRTTDIEQYEWPGLDYTSASGLKTDILAVSPQVWSGVELVALPAAGWIVRATKTTITRTAE